MFESHKVSKEIKQQRLEICKSCEHNKVGVCSKCGCVLTLKTQWKATKCPVEKWGSVTQEVSNG